MARVNHEKQRQLNFPYFALPFHVKLSFPLFFDWSTDSVAFNSDSYPHVIPIFACTSLFLRTTFHCSRVDVGAGIEWVNNRKESKWKCSECISSSPGNSFNSRKRLANLVTRLYFLREVPICYTCDNRWVLTAFWNTRGSFIPMWRERDLNHHAIYFSPLKSNRIGEEVKGESISSLSCRDLEIIHDLYGLFDGNPKV